MEDNSNAAINLDSVSPQATMASMGAPGIPPREQAMQISVGRETSFYTNDLPDAVLQLVLDQLTFPNPAYQEAEKRGRYTGNIPWVIRGYARFEEQIIVPRGFTRQLLTIFRQAGVGYQFNDHRRVLHEVDLTFTGQLRDYQELAVSKVMGRDFGVLEAPPREWQDGHGPGPGGLAAATDHGHRPY